MIPITDFLLLVQNNRMLCNIAVATELGVADWQPLGFPGMSGVHLCSCLAWCFGYMELVP